MPPFFFTRLNLLKLLTNPFISEPAIKRIQQAKLKKLIAHSYKYVPYYQKLFDSMRINPKDIKNSDDLKFIPVMTKKTLQELSIEEKTAKNIDLSECRYSSTSGTTGRPLKSYFTKTDSVMKNLSWIRAFSLSGMKPWYKSVKFIGNEKEKENKSLHEYFGLWRIYEVSTIKNETDWIRTLQRIKPHIILGYVMTLKILAENIEKSGIKQIAPEYIYHTSAILDKSSREYLESVFHTDVRDFYGSEEVGNISWECKKCNGYHINSDTLIVEILKNNKQVEQGELGDVVVTNLHSYAMPFIRYKLGDLATYSGYNSSCKNKFPLLKNVLGREDDFVVLKSGKKLSPHPLYHCIDPVPGIKRWRMIQENINHLIVEIEPGMDFNKNAQQIIENNLKKLVRDEIDIKIRRVDSISISPSLNFRSVISCVGKD